MSEGYVIASAELSIIREAARLIEQMQETKEKLKNLSFDDRQRMLYDEYGEQVKGVLRNPDVSDYLYSTSAEERKSFREMTEDYFGGYATVEKLISVAVLLMPNHTEEFCM